MSDPISDAEKIRNKRLAKLGSSGPVPSLGSEQDSNTSASPSQSSHISGNETATSAVNEPSKAQRNTSDLPLASGPIQNSASQVGLRLANGGSWPQIKISSSGTSQTNNLKRDRPSSANERPISTTKEPLDIWEHKALSSIFRLTLDPSSRKDIHGHPLYYVQGVKDDLEEQDIAIQLSTDVLDQAILEAASNQEKSTPLDYLLLCWKRVSKQFRAAKSPKIEEAKMAVIKEARRLCMSYCIFAVTMPDMFGREVPPSSPLVPHLLVDPENDRGICYDFLMEIVSRFPEDDIAQEAMVTAIEDSSRQLAKMSMNDDYKPYVFSLRNLVRYPALVNALVNSPRFLPPDTPASNIEVDTLLGPFFQISPLQADVTSTYFSSPKTRSQNAINESQNALRLTLRTHQQDLFDITNHIIKTSKEARERMLDWFAACVNANHKRRAMQVDRKTVSSDGFMINITVCLDQLSEPFMDATFSKVDRIDVGYLRRRPRVEIKDETKLDADQHASDEFYSYQLEGQSNFISEVFFLTLAAHHYGIDATNQMLGQMEKHLKYMETQVERMEADRHKFEANPRHLEEFERAVKKYKDQIDKGLSYKFAVQGVLLDELTQARCMQFMRYVIVWLLRTVAPGQDIPRQAIHLPLPAEQPDVFKCLPEYFLEDVIESFTFLLRSMPVIITSTQSDELIMLCITFLESSEYIRNPYLKSGLVTVLSSGLLPLHGRAKGVLGDHLNSLPFATEHLLHALLKCYIEVENTGTHGQFYEKFNIRHRIFHIIKAIWDNGIYRKRLAEEAKSNVEFFVRFVNLLLNDVTFVLDESLSAFVKIYELSEELKNPALTDQALRTDKQELLAEAQEKAKSYMQLTNETVAMLKLFTGALADSFTMPEIVQRLADMLDYNLDAMVGPKSNQLKVENLAEYGFRPKLLLSEIVDVYLNLGTKENFVLAVARDGRSYKPANFENATTILRSRALKSQEDLAAWTALGERFKKAKEIDDQDEEDLGEVPEEFLDPLMFTIMEDPVILPTSRTTIDRSTIRSHLLSDPNDPFNRSPLMIEDVMPNVDLKARIQAFRAEKKGRKLAEANVMDTTSG